MFFVCVRVFKEVDSLHAAISVLNLFFKKKTVISSSDFKCNFSILINTIFRYFTMGIYIKCLYNSENTHIYLTVFISLARIKNDSVTLGSLFLSVHQEKTPKITNTNIQIIALVLCSNPFKSLIAPK